MIRMALLGFILLANYAAAQLQTDEYWTDWPTIEIKKESKETVTLNPDIQWRLDCGLDSGELIGKIFSAAPGSNERIYLLDEQLTQVLIMSSDGKIEETFGQQGEGPGDLPGAYRLFELSDGRIGVCGGVEAPTFLLGVPSKIVLLNQRFEPAGQWLCIGDRSAMVVATIRELRCAGDHVMISSTGAMFNEGIITQIQEIAVIDPQEGERMLISQRSIVEDLSEGHIAERNIYNPYAYGRCDVSNTGRVAFAPDRDRWQVVIRNSDGGGIVLKREWDPLKRTKDQKEKIRKDLGGYEGCVVLNNEPAIASVRWRPNGNLWVEPYCAEFRDGSLACFDEFSPAGEYLRRIKISVLDWDSSYDLQVLEDGRFVVLRGFVDDSEDDDTSEQKGEVFLLKVKEN